MTTMKLLGSLCAIALAGTGVAHAYSITPVSVVASSQLSFDPAINTINGSGLVGGQHSNIQSDMWLSAAIDTAPVITFDLGGIYNLSSISIWNYNEYAATYRGIASASASVSSDGVNFTQVIPSVSLYQAPGDSFIGPQVVSLSADAVEFVKLSTLSSYNTLNGYAGLSEVSLGGSLSDEAIPEPASILLLSVCVAGVVCLYRRREIECVV